MILVARKGVVGFHRGYGHLDPETRQCPTPAGAIFDLASLTKLFTVTGFARLVEAAAVSLTTPVAEVVPEFGGRRPIAPTVDPLTHRTQSVPWEYAGQEVDAGRVTFHHLLTHTSGLPGWAPLYQEAGREEVMRAVYRSPFARPPGAELIYSDLGLIVLGEAVSRLHARSLDAALADLVFGPLGLVDIGYNPPPEWRPRILPTEWCPWRGRRVHAEVHDENAARLGGIAGHAGLFATAWAVATLGQCYLNGGRYGGVRLLSENMVSRMVREQVRSGTVRRGLGWLLQSPYTVSAGRRLGPRAFGHTGFTGTSIWADPDLDLLVVALTNRVYFGRDARAITGFRGRLHDAVVEAVRAPRQHPSRGG